MVKYLVALLLLASPLRAQVFYGDTSITRINSPTRGYFYVDTLSYVGHEKVDKKKPWVYEIKPPLYYYDWWMRTGQCQGIRTNVGEFRRFRWFIVNAEIFGTDSPSKIGYGAYTLLDSMAIYLAAPFKDDGGILQHEVTHALMFLHGEKMAHSFRRFGPFGCAMNYVSWKTADPER